MDELSESHKQALRFLVKAVRDKEIPEEFTIRWTGAAAVIDSTSRGQVVKVPNLTQLAAEVLTDAGLLFSSVQHRTSSTEGSPPVLPGVRKSIHQRTYESHRICLVTPAGFRAVDSNFAPIIDVSVRRPPVEITDSLALFRADFPDVSRLAFIMMQFGSSTAHQNIHAGIRAALDPHQMVALRADDKQYHDDLYFNILTYIYGCRFGIAVFDRIEKDAFNPNVSLEVGYMLGLGKSVCFLKDRTLNTLQSDLMGKLYRTFEPQNPEGTIPPELFSWMDQKGFIVRH